MRAALTIACTHRLNKRGRVFDFLKSGQRRAHWVLFE
jgi:hypothetical protein